MRNPGYQSVRHRTGPQHLALYSCSLFHSRREGDRGFETAVARELLAGYVEKLASWAIDDDGEESQSHDGGDDMGGARLGALLCCLGEHLPEGTK